MESPMSPIITPSSFPSPLLLAHSPIDIYSGLNSLTISSNVSQQANSTSPNSPLSKSTHQVQVVHNNPRNAPSPSTSVNLLPSTSSISLLSLSFTDQNEPHETFSDNTSPIHKSTPGSPIMTSATSISSPSSPNFHPSRILPPQRARMKHYFSRSTSVVISGSGSGSSVAGIRSHQPDHFLRNNSNASIDQLIPPESPLLKPMSLGSSPTAFMLNQGPPDLSASSSTTSFYFTPMKRTSSSSLRPLQIPVSPYTYQNESGLSIETPDSPTLHPVGTPAEEPMTPMVLEDF